MLHIQQDIHIHTTLSSCAQEDATVENYLGRAKEDGLTLLGFSNHLWDQDVPGASNWYRPQNVEHVLAPCAGAAERHSAAVWLRNRIYV